MRAWWSRWVLGAALALCGAYAPDALASTWLAGTSACSGCHLTPPALASQANPFGAGSTSDPRKIVPLVNDSAIDSDCAGTFACALRTKINNNVNMGTSVTNQFTAAQLDAVRQYLLKVRDGVVGAPSATPTFAATGTGSNSLSNFFTVTIDNYRGTAISVGTPTFTNSDFSLASSSLTCSGFAAASIPAVAAADQSSNQCVLTLRLRFTPSAAGTRSGTMRIKLNQTGGDPALDPASNNADKAIALSASAFVPTPGFQLSTTTITLASPLSVALNSADLIITNPVSATANLVLGNMVTPNPISGTALADYSLQAASTSPCTLTGTTLTPGSSCRVFVRFTPSAAGARNALLTIPNNAGATGQVSLNGTGQQGTIALSPASFNFASVAQGSTSQTTFTLTNTGTAAIGSPSVAVTGPVGGDTPGDFARTGGTCGTSVTSLVPLSQNAAANCTVIITFTPSTTVALGPGGSSARAATLTFSGTGNTSGNSPTARVTGTSAGLANPSASAALSFSGTTVGTTNGTPGVITLTNTRTNAVGYTLSVLGTNASDFTGVVPVESCGTHVIPGGGSCTVTFRFSPAVAGGAGLRSASASFALTGTGTDPAPTNTPLAVGLSGTATTSPGFSITATTLAPSVEFGTTGPASSLTVTNTGTAALVLSTLVPGGSFPGDYAFGGTCSNGISLPPSSGAASSCSITVAFTPGAVGSRSATLTINHNDATVNAGATVVTLSGTGTPSLTPVLDLLGVTQLAFGDINQGANSTQTLTVRNGNSNVGATAMTITGLSVSGAAAADYTRGGSCTTSTSLGASQSCTVNITFAPAAAGTRSATLAITTGNAGNASIPLSGNGVALPDATLSGVPLTAFPSTLVGTTGATIRTVTINNPRGNPITYGTAFAGTNATDFQIASESCGTHVVPAGAACNVGIRFAPANGSAGSRTGSLVLSFVGSGTDPNPTNLSTGLSGTAALPAPGFSITSTSLSFSAPVNTTASSATLTISNIGTATLTLNTIVLGGSFTADYSVGGSCSNGTVLAVAGLPGSSCTVTLGFTPGAVGSRDATLTITHNDPTVNAGSTVVSIAGTGTASLAPALDLSGVSQLSFGNVNQGASGQLTLTVRNGNSTVGATALALNGLTISGAAGTDFTRAGSGTCTPTSSLGPGLSCTVVVTFTPSAAGLRAGSLAVSTSNAGSANVALTGTGVALPDATLAGVPLSSFPSTLVGTTSATVRTLTITNPRSNPITYGTAFGGTNGADFQVGTESCATHIVPAGGSCTVAVRFAPVNGSAGTRNATLALAFVGSGTDPNPSTLTTGVSGTAALPAPAFSISASSVTLSSVVGIPASAATLTVTNSGTAALTLGSLVLGGGFPGDYTLGGTCTNGISLSGPTAPCTIVVNFTPGAVGARGATITVSHNDSTVDGGSTVVTLAGSGTASTNPVLDLAGVTQISFGDVALGGSVQQTLTVRNGNTNSSATALALSGLAISGSASADFTRGGTCTSSTSLASNQTCTVVLTFAPLSAGARTATLSVTSSNAGGASVALSGNGLALPDATLTGVPLTAFPSTLVGTTSATTRTLTINNPRVNSITYGTAFGGANGGDFAVGSESCATHVVPAGGSCTVVVQFSPANGAAGSRSATLALAFVGSGSDPNPATLTTAVSGTAALPAPAFSISSSILSLTATVGVPVTTSAVISNTGSAALQLSALSIAGSQAADFSLDASNACLANTSLAPSANCTLTVRYNPAAVGNGSATLTVTSNAADSPHAIALQGTATAAPQPAIALSSLALSFGNQAVGAAASQTVTVQNTGTAALTFSSFGISGTASGDFTRSGSCAVGTALAVGSQCDLIVSFQPTAAGSRGASLLIQSDASNGAATVSLSGTGVSAAAPAVSLSSSAGLPLEFGSQTIGGLYPSRRITLANTGNADLALSAVTVEGTGFRNASAAACPSTLVAGASCNIDIGFTPTTAGTDYNGTLRITSNALGSPHTAALHGRGTAAVVPSLVWEPLVSRIDFGQVTAGSVSATQSATLRNRGPGGATLALLNAIGVDAAAFSVAAGDCQIGQTLFEGQSCRIDFSFAPATAGTKTATVQVAGSGSAPSDLVLNGVGLGGPNPGLALSTASLSFGTVRLGSQSAPIEVTLSANGSGVVRVLSLIVSEGWVLQNKSCPAAPFTLQAGSECTVTLSFSPRAGGAATGQLTVSSDAQSGSTRQVTLSGTGEAPADLSSGGCSISRGGDGFDPTLWLLALLAAAGLVYRRQRRAAA
jgi:hypothetical protein